MATIAPPHVRGHSIAARHARIAGPAFRAAAPLGSLGRGGAEPALVGSAVAGHVVRLPGAAEAERTVVHELGHVLQMHTGGHIDSNLVGYQWEAHAEYCTQLFNASWAPHGEYQPKA